MGPSEVPPSLSYWFPPADCYLGKSRLRLRVFRNVDAPAQSGEPSACVRGAPLSRAGPRQQKEFALPPGVLAGWGTYRTGEREDQLPSLSLSREKGSQAFSSLGLQEAPGRDRSPLWGLPLLPVSPQESGPQPTCGFRTSTTNISMVSHLRGEQPLRS